MKSLASARDEICDIIADEIFCKSKSHKGVRIRVEKKTRFLTTLIYPPTSGG